LEVRLTFDSTSDPSLLRFLSVGTLEEKIYQRQLLKDELFSCVVDDERHAIRNFNSKDIRALFRLEAEELR